MCSSDLFSQDGVERLARDKFHRNEALTIDFSGFKDADDSRMVEDSSSSEFAKRTIRGVARVQNLDGDWTVEQCIAGRVYGAGATLTELGLDFVMGDSGIAQRHDDPLGPLNHRGKVSPNR